MAKITNLRVLNSADKSRHYAVCTGSGPIEDVDDPIVSDVVTYPVGSQYIDLANRTQHIRYAVTGVVADWA